MPKITVCITTYNLEEYIEQALDSVLMQKTNFDYRIIVADDCSSDKTREILLRYQKEHPDLIKLILNDKNLGSLGNSNQIFDKLGSDYFIFLDGDDYWIDADMLQKMADYLDSHPECSLVGGNTYYLRNNEYVGLVIEPSQANKDYDFGDYVSGKMPFVHTSALLVRNCIFSSGLPKCYIDAVDTFENCALRGEDFRRLTHLQRGKLHVMDGIFSVYRIHAKGMWQGASDLKRRMENAIAWNFYAKYFGDIFDNYFIKMKQETYRHLMMHLVSNYGLCRGNFLPKKESKLLADYLDDIRSDETCKYGKFRSLMLRVFLHFFA